MSYIAVTYSSLWASSWRVWLPASQWFCGICVVWLTLWQLNFLLFFFIEVSHENSWNRIQVWTPSERSVSWSVHLRQPQCSTAGILWPPFIITWTSISWSPVPRQAHRCACHLLWGTVLPQGHLIMWLCIQMPPVGNLNGRRGVTGWIKVTPEETLLKERAKLREPAAHQWSHWQWWTQLCPLCCCRAGRWAHRKMGVYKRWREERKKGLNNILSCPHYPGCKTFYILWHNSKAVSKE